jgi:hypothetical protein
MASQSNKKIVTQQVWLWFSVYERVHTLYREQAIPVWVHCFCNCSMIVMHPGLTKGGVSNVFNLKMFPTQFTCTSRWHPIGRHLGATNGAQTQKFSPHSSSQRFLAECGPDCCTLLHCCFHQFSLLDIRFQFLLLIENNWQRLHGRSADVYFWIWQPTLAVAVGRSMIQRSLGETRRWVSRKFPSRTCENQKWRKQPSGTETVNSLRSILIRKFQRRVIFLWNLCVQDRHKLHKEHVSWPRLILCN